MGAARSPSAPEPSTAPASSTVTGSARVVAQGKFSAPFTIEGTLPEAATIRGLTDYVEGNLAVPWSWSFPSVGSVPGDLRLAARHGRHPHLQCGPVRRPGFRRRRQLPVPPGRRVPAGDRWTAGTCAWA